MRANLTGANLKKADLTDANLYGSNIEDTDFSGAIMPDGEVYNHEAFERQPRRQEASLEKLLPATRKVIFTDQAPVPVGAYSQAIASSGQLIFVAGQIAIDLRLNGIVYQNTLEAKSLRA